MPVPEGLDHLLDAEHPQGLDVVRQSTACPCAIYTLSVTPQSVTIMPCNMSHPCNIYYGFKPRWRQASHLHCSQALVVL